MGGSNICTNHGTVWDTSQWNVSQCDVKSLSNIVHMCCCIEDNAHVPCWTGRCKAHNIRYTDVLTDLTLVTHSSVCTYEPHSGNSSVSEPHSGHVYVSEPTVECSVSVGYVLCVKCELCTGCGYTNLHKLL